jgi:transposase
MERSTIYYLKKKGWTNTQIAAFTGHHRDTIARVLREPVERRPQPRQRPSQAEVFDEPIGQWLTQGLSVTRMLELAQADPAHPYHGKPTAFFDYVRKRRRQLQQPSPRDVAVRFEGLPGEFLQIDWGEVRDFPFTRPDLAPGPGPGPGPGQSQTRYFFAARLKYSRYMQVSFQTDMREETLLRCLIATFVAVGGVPWVVTTDNMKTVVLGRDEHHEPVWQPSYQKLAAEFGFHPEACTPAAGNQKGAVENLVKFVKGNFLAGRVFYDDVDLAAECASWLEQVNTQRPSAATDHPPVQLLAEEQGRFGPLPAQADDYGFFDSVVVSREGLVVLETNAYSVPAHLLGQVLTARIHRTRIELFSGVQRVAVHVRHPGQHVRIVDPAHFEATFQVKPRARVMVYRDWLLALAPVAGHYVSEVCRRRRTEMSQQILTLYELAQRLGRADFVAALELAAEQHTYGAEYIAALGAVPAALRRHAAVGPPSRTPPGGEAADALTVVLASPEQADVERDLAHYERYVANRDLPQLPERSPDWPAAPSRTSLHAGGRP